MNFKVQCRMYGFVLQTKGTSTQSLRVDRSRGHKRHNPSVFERALMYACHHSTVRSVMRFYNKIILQL